MNIRQIASLITEQGVILEDDDFKYKIHTLGQNNRGEVGKLRKELERIQHKLDLARQEGRHERHYIRLDEHITYLEQMIANAEQRGGYGPNVILADDIKDAGKPWIFVGIGPEVMSWAKKSRRNRLPKEWYYHKNEDFDAWLPEARRVITNAIRGLDQPESGEEGDLLTDIDVFEHGRGSDYHLRRMLQYFGLQLSDNDVEKLFNNEYVEAIMSRRPENPQGYKKHTRILTIKKSNISKIEKIRAT